MGNVGYTGERYGKGYYNGKREREMGKTAFLRLGTGVVAVVLVCGCAAMGRGPSDEELVSALIEKWKAAVVAQDIDALIALFSENYEGAEGDKYDTKLFLLEGKDMGYFEGIEVDLEGAETTIEGSTATAYPLAVKSAMTEAKIELRFAKESAGWTITGMDIED